MDDFREWLSDNLRYFELGGAILLVVLLLIFGIRSCSGRRRSSRQDKQTASTQTQSGENTSDTEVTDDGEEEEPQEPLVEADDDVSALIRSYYQALNDKDVEAVRVLVDELAPSDEPKITNSDVGNYVVDNIYTKSGLTESAKAVYVTYTYQCAGIETPVPDASWLYVVKDENGTWRIDSDASADSEISAYMNALKDDEDVAELTAQVSQAHNAALASDPELAAYLNGLGASAPEQTQTEENGTRMMATTVVNVRSGPGGDGADVIGELEEGQIVTATGTEGDWIQISYEGQTAYVFGEYLTTVSEDNADAAA